MRYKIFFLFFFMTISSLATAQLYNSALLNPLLPYDNLSQSIVRNWNDSYVLAFHPKPVTLFSCTDYSKFFEPYNPSCFTADGYCSDPLPSNYYVNDIRIVDDTAWFCGFSQQGTPENPDFYGFVGWFDLNDFLSGSFNLYYCDLRFASSLKKMVVYHDNGQCKAVCIGVDKASVPNSLVVEIDKTATATTCNAFTAGGGFNEIFYDILYTGTNVVVTGRVETGTSFSFTVRSWDNPSSIQASSLNNWNNLVVFYNPPDDLFSSTKSIFLESGDIAIIYDHYIGGTSFTSRLRVINVNSFPPQNYISQEFSIFKNSEASEMVYHKGNKKLVVLQPNQYIYHYLPQFTFLEPYNTLSYNANFTHFSDDYNFCSMDLYKMNNFVSVCWKGTYLQYIPLQKNSGCPYADTVKVYPLLNVSDITVLDPLATSTHSISSFSYNLNTDNLQWKCDCCSTY